MDPTVAPKGRAVAAVDSKRAVESSKSYGWAGGQARVHWLRLSSRMEAVPIDGSCVGLGSIRALLGRSQVASADSPPPRSADQRPPGSASAPMVSGHASSPAPSLPSSPHGHSPSVRSPQRPRRFSSRVEPVAAQLSGRRARPPVRSRARRRTRRLLELGMRPARSGCAPGRRAPAEGRRGFRDGRPPARPPLEPSRRAGRAQARPARPGDTRRGRVLAGPATRVLRLGARTRSAPRPRDCSCRS